jgi:hypothetical protein
MRNRFDLAREQVYAEYPDVQALWSALAGGADGLMKIIS